MQSETVTIGSHTATLTTGDDGWVVVNVTTLQGCITQGRNREEALATAVEAIEVSEP